ncbi:MAG: undecaprenyl-phosphate glucose phosphotransferase [Phycisphaerae bacterium]|nr:undecaprenyl-phosphate glucose phosphotransferase [Phycisphaerae bacterium]
MLKQRHQFFVSLLCAVDGVVAIAACLGAWSVRRLLIDGGFPDAATREGLAEWVRQPLWLLAAPIVLIAMWGFGLYRPRRDRAFIAESQQVFKATLSTSVTLIVILWAMGPRTVADWAGEGVLQLGSAVVDGGRLQLGVLVVLLPVAVTVHRGLFRIALRAVRRRGWNLRHVAIVGTGRLGRIACRTLDRNSWTGLHVAYFISHQEHAHPGAVCLDRPILGGVKDLDTILEENKPDAVYLALPAPRAVMIPELLKRLSRHALDVRLIPDVHPKYMPQSMTVGDLEGMPILSVRESPMTGFPGLAKQLVDFVGATIGLMVFGPVMLIIACLVRLSSPGPVIFKQRRVSLGGQTFDIFKFRTMYHAEDEASPAGWTRRNDPRITPIGKWLRATSLDELPQLFNVWRGDMSLVGPRPERPELIERFRDDWRGYMLRQHVKAGITGWAQVNGLRGDTSLRKRLQYDLAYVRNWSLGFDLKILWLTLFRGFLNRNAH